MTNIEFADKAKEIAKLDTLYVNGAWGQLLTDANKRKFITSNNYNRQESRQAKILRAKSTCRGFDCVCLIKSILWGFPNMKYASNGVPDISEDNLIKQCNPSTNFKADIPVGAILWMQGHCGISIGDGLCVECTPSWKDGVQITNIGNIRGYHKDYPSRVWTKWGRLPYLTYEDDEMVKTIKVLNKNTNQVVEVQAIEKDGTNYIRIRDFMDKLDIVKVGWDATTKMITIE